MNLLRSHPPDDVQYSTVGGFHVGGPGAGCNVPVEVALNRIVRRATIPDMGFRALGLRKHFDLAHVHAHPVRLARLRGTPLVMSEGSSTAVYLGDYLGWDEIRLAQGLPRQPPDLSGARDPRPAAGDGPRRARLRVLELGSRRESALGRRPEQARRRRAGVSDSRPGRAYRRG